MIPSFYSLNVSLHGSHFCRIDLGTSKQQAKDKARVIAAKLGYQYVCELTYVECIGHPEAF